MIERFERADVERDQARKRRMLTFVVIGGKLVGVALFDYLAQMPGWSRRLRIMIDWTFALLFRPDIVKISLDSETVLLLREAAAGAVHERGQTEASHPSGEPSSAGVVAPRVEAG